MDISYKWLKEYVDFNLSPDEVCQALTSTGLEVGGIEEKQSIKGGLKGLYVGEVLSCENHPDSDHLHVTTVSLGRETPLQIVCGASNVAVGQKVIVADIGCTLYDGDKEFRIKKSKLRGVDSYGMICAEDEIGVGNSHDGIIVLPPDTPVGMAASEYYNLESDYLIEIDITANRADALSHWGVARDLYAWLKQNGYQTSLHRPTCDDFKVTDNSLTIDVEIQNREACPRYACVSLTGCEVKESPEWLRQRLSTIGIRPINNIVDITNYIMMAYGQPLHCFDADMVEGHKIIVKDQNSGKHFITLDGEEHILGEHDLAICNITEPMAIAGVFGGKGSGTYASTHNIVLESAYFHPTWIRKSARAHGLSTDASFRFERGVDPDGTIYALKQAAILCCQLAGGKVAMDIRDEYPVKITSPEVELRYSYINSLIGKTIDADVVKSIVESLDMTILNSSNNGLRLRIPAYRVDVTRECDVVEDILRIYGYNNVEIPTQLKSSLVIPTEEDRRYRLENRIAEQLIGAGFNEILNNSLTKSSYYDSVSDYSEDTIVKIMNPLSSDLNVMRQTLLFGGLESIAYNVNRKKANLHLFEFGNIYTFNPKNYDPEQPMKSYKEDYHLALWITGKRVSLSWIHQDEESNFYELKANVENILARIGVEKGSLCTKKAESVLFSKAMQIDTKNGKPICRMGIVSKRVLSEMGIDAPVYYAELSWTTLMTLTKNKQPLFRPVAKFPAVSRDLALLLDRSVEFSEVETIICKSDPKIIQQVELFDVYEGDKLPQGKKSYAVNILLQDESRTMGDKQIEAIMQKVITNLKNQLKAELR